METGLPPGKYYNAFVNHFISSKTDIIIHYNGIYMYFVLYIHYNAGAGNKEVTLQFARKSFFPGILQF